MTRGGLAPGRAAWWWRQYIGGPMGPSGGGAGSVPVPFPQAPLPIAVDLFMFGNWVDVTRLSSGQAGVYARDGIEITRGRRSEGSTVDPTRISLTLNNRDGRYSPRNPTSILYGQIGRNTPLRVRVGNDVRGVGEVSEWPAKSDVTGTDVWVPITASGILRRLGQGAAPIRSPLYRWYLSGQVPNLAGAAIDTPVAYWPAEDLSGATRLASAIGGQAMAIAAGSPQLAANNDFPGSDPIPTVGQSRWTGPVPAYSTASGTSTVGFLLSVPAAGATNGAVLLRVRTNGTAARWDLTYLTASSGEMQMLVYDQSGTLLFTSGLFATGTNGNPMQVALRLIQSGADANIGLSFEGVYPGAGAAQSDGPIAGRTVGRIVSVQVGPNGNVDDVGFGHITVWNNEASLAFTVTADTLSLSPVEGYRTETAGNRIFRLCGEESIQYGRIDPSYPSTPLGVQQSGTLIDLLQGAAAADLGILFEPRDFLGLAFVARDTLYNRPAAVTLDYSAGQMSTLEPVDDDRGTRNDITVQRTGGSSDRQVMDTGPLSVQPPPDGVGKYDEQVTVNVADDTQLPDQAGFRLRIGTVDEARYPQITMTLAASAFATNAALTEAVRALDIGQRLDVTNPPAWLPPDDIVQGVDGTAETLNAYEQTITVNLVPDAPWRVGFYDAADAFYLSDGSALDAAVTDVATSLSVATPSGPLWVTGAVSIPIRVGGEDMTVTNIAGATSPQTFTVTRAVNTVVKPHAAGAALTLQPTSYYAL